MVAEFRQPRIVSDPASHLSVETLYCDHHGWLQAYLRRKLGNSSDAAELAHDTFVRILAAPAHTPERQAGWHLNEPRAYLTIIAKRLVSNFYRRRSLEQAYLDVLATMPQPSVASEEQRLIILESLQEIDALLDSLTPKLRSAFLMAQLEGLPYAEIARQLAVSERTVKRYVTDALARCILLMA
ncbi:sigma-70 family RNA polymerase sigma factor [Bordetella petrii]|nr:sigma-70 family RNA polymerase sigma factor [Bordetella petrii]